MKSNWVNALTYKPDVNEIDEWDKEHALTERVVVWIEGDDCARFGRYNHFTKNWTVEGYLGFDQNRVKNWQYITNPYN